MKILITGANGLLGQYLVEHFLQKGHQVIATGKGPSRLPVRESSTYSYHSLDICDAAAIRRFGAEQQHFDSLIHAAARTQVDDCEINRDAAWENNVTGTQNLIDCLSPLPRHFIYISTDFVFDGERGNYDESDALGPVNWYGQTKVKAEELVQAIPVPWAIIRTCLVYGNSHDGTRSNIISWVKANLEKQNPIKVVSDQVRTPTYVEDLANGIVLAAEKSATGIFHISGDETLTPYEMALKTIAHFGFDESLITRVDAATFSQPGKRPLKTGFITEKAKAVLGYQPGTFEAALKKMYPAVQ